MSDETLTNGETTTEQETTEISNLILYASLTDDGGFDITINGNQDPIVIAGIAWYLERMAGRGLAILQQLQAQEAAANTPAVFGPDGVTPIPLNRQQRRHPTSH